MFKFLISILLSFVALNCYSATNNCPNSSTVGGTKICHYDTTSASNYAINNYAIAEKGTDNTFAAYPQNCTNFVSQAILAGFTAKTTRSGVYNLREQYLADELDQYSWFYRSKYDKGNVWSEAHSLYLYAKASTAEVSPYDYSGVKFDFVTNDSLTKFMDYKKVQVGDIIFADFENDGKMNHAFIVSRIQSWRSGYNEIRVTANTLTYDNKGLGDININNDMKIIFYVYRPKAYVIK